MTGPRTKRQFAGAAADPCQRQITRFFPPSDGQLPPREQPSRPDLPNSVQNDLMQVGMRIRKSVPEGYKTGDSYGSFKLFSDTGPSAQAPRRPKYVSADAQRELLPFSGIHKTGGLSCQPMTIRHNTPSFDDVPGLSSSQGSFLGSDDDDNSHPSSQTANSRKRFYDADEKADVPVDHGLKVRQDWLDGEISPRTMAPLDWRDNRPMAVPRRRTITPFKRVGPVAGGQENVVMDDFGDAKFLDDSLLDEMQMDS